MEKITAKSLTDKGICPTCFNRAHNFCLTGDETPHILFENDLFQCILTREPRADGHAIIVSKEHFKDMTEITDALCHEVFIFAKKAMNALKQVYGAESVYLCTMCDGPMNHFHVQLIPRYSFENRGSQNFTKSRKTYKYDAEKISILRKMLAE